MGKSEVDPAFAIASGKACIRALRGLEQTAIMLEKWGPECFPENEHGQVHFARALMESAAEAIRSAWQQAIDEAAKLSKSEPEPDWFWCVIDPDESGDSAYQAMHGYRPRLVPIELGTSFAGPTMWGVMAPPLPDADDDGETAHTFSTREEAEAFCASRIQPPVPE